MFRSNLYKVKGLSNEDRRLPHVQYSITGCAGMVSGPGPRPQPEKRTFLGALHGGQPRSPHTFRRLNSKPGVGQSDGSGRTSGRRQGLSVLLTGKPLLLPNQFANDFCAEFLEISYRRTQKMLVLVFPSVQLTLHLLPPRRGPTG